MDSPNAAYSDNSAFLQDLRALGESMIERALLARQPGADSAADGDDKLDSLYRQASGSQPSPSQLQQQIAQLDAAQEVQWQAMQTRIAATVEAQVFIPWIHLAALFKLSRQDQACMLFGLLAEIEPRYGAILRALGGAAAGASDPQGNWVDLSGLAAALGGSVAARLTLQQCLMADATLRYWELIELAPNTRLAGLEGSIQLSPAIAVYLLAKAAPQLRLAQPLEPVDSTLAMADHLVDEQVLQQLSRFIDQCGLESGNAGAKASGYVLQLQGPDLALERSLCAAAFEQMQMRCVALDGREIWQAYLSSHKNRATLLLRLRLLCRDALLCNRVCVLLHCQWLGAQDAADDLLEDVFHTLLESQRYLAVLNGPARRLSDLAYRYTRHDVASVLIKISVPDSRLRMRIWQRHGAACGIVLTAAMLDKLVNNYLFTEEQIVMAIKDAAGRKILNPDQASADALLFDACREQSNREQMMVAREVKTPHRFSDIVLPDETRQWLQEVLQYAQQRHQVIENWGFDTKNQNSKNLCILFYGPSGTGKTMAASIIANELNLGLYKIDLANIVSKYIGETEKHLAQLFDQAEAMNIVLFFDEAESLFSKRTETKDAHDRYANLQTGYLLQRIETYPGIVILSTNLLANMDKAFTRRFKFMIEYPFPGGEQRLQLWRNAFPAATPLADDVDFALLAKSAALSGGSINNIAVGAAFLAAAEQQAVAQRHVLKATEREYNKLGKVFSAGDFRWDDDE
ncbi:ATP-binding protein [Collimonas silvisoli]|uniref:ATP-binding protein n=1 Tax=Collimonas silvisoli TaxID=2825884 RepID=UPI001B8ADC6E|nr:ATP-binding protein [Collimonas silvisoli]